MELESGNNPFKFEPIHTFNDESDKPLVIMASPGMLQNGQSRDLFVKWAPHTQNGIVFTGYSVEGTLAKNVINRPKSVVINDQALELKLSIEYISFSAHCDYQQTEQYIK
jgi:cleavage and polyadenylation specificity factor subunit 3